MPEKFTHGSSEQRMTWFKRGQSMKTAVRAYDAHIVRALAALDQIEEAQEIMNRLEEESKPTILTRPPNPLILTACAAPIELASFGAKIPLS